MYTPEQILKQYWGYDSFRPLQREIIASVMEGKDTLALLPTGGGKSVCYQVPALGTKGVCLVISPLIALMQDQVTRLKSLDIPAACIHAGMHFYDVKRVLENTVQRGYKLLYVSPERLQTDLFLDFVADFDVNLVAIDEAHCVSQWGHDFRPDYLKIAELRDVFKDVPMLALTASATTDVQDDILQQLKLDDPIVFKSSFERSNLLYKVQYSENKQRDTVAALQKGSSIIYCRSRKQTEVLSKYLTQTDTPATCYHAGMAKDKREEAQQAWMDNTQPIMVATTAFGMGIDKPDVRMVLHYDAPEHMEAYYQEAGRAGRDGKPSDALAFYNSTDIKKLEESTALHFPPEAFLRLVYQSVTEYLQVPIGVEPYKYYSFDLYDFSTKFNLPPAQAGHALKLLEREGLWTISEAVFRPATIHFTADRQMLDELGNNYPTLGYVAVGLLRMYGTIFHYPTSVRLKAVAKQLKMRMEELEQALMKLQDMCVLAYTKPTEGPQMFFHHYRVDSRHLIIDMNRISRLRKRHEDRTNAMIAFLLNEKYCRERMMLAYFGEEPKKDCGHCDICIKKNTRPNISNKELRTQVSTMVREHNVTVQILIAQFHPAIKEQLLSLIRELIDEGALLLQDNGTITYK